LVKAESLPSFRGLEPRGAVWVQIATDAGRLDLINTHLGLTSSERRAQITRLLGADWVGGVDKDMPLILTGDFNCIPRSRSYRLLTRSLVDGQMQHPVRSRATFPSALPLLRIDYAFISKTIHVAQIAPVRSAETQLASDHLPLQMDFELTKTDR
jgi:endonuclease/exonuclease/phosphatase family metal-dependent hydrolase